MSRVKAVHRRPHKGRVYNLAVTGDETYFADGVLVHNCRSIIIVIDFEDWNPDLVTKRRPNIAPQRGFGITGGEPFR